MPQTLPAPLQSKLSSARTRLRAVDLALGLARAVLVVSAALVALFALDTALEPPLAVLRAFALFLVMVAGAGVTMALATPLRRRLSDDVVALLVEQEYPELEGGLVSSVQLSRELDRDDLYTSRSLIRSTIDRTATQVETIPGFGRIVRTGPLIPLWLMIASFLLVGATLFTNPSVQEYGGIFYRRVVLGEEVYYPTLVGLRLDLEPRIQVAKGDDLNVDVFLDKGGHLVSRLVVNTRYLDGRPSESRELLRKGQTHYQKLFQNVTEPFTFYVDSPEHGVHTQTYRVDVVQRPRIEDYEFVLDYPEYIGKASETVRQPDLQVPAGTRITLLAVANKPLSAAELLFARERGAGRSRAAARGANAPEADVEVAKPGPLPLGEVRGELAAGGEWAALADSVERLQLQDPRFDERALVGRFTVKDDMQFRFRITSEEGLENGNRPVSFSVRVVADRAPIVTIPTPGKSKEVTPQAKLPLLIEVRDDYGVAGAELRLQVQRANQPEPDAERVVPLASARSGAKHERIEHVVDVADLRLLPGDRVKYKAVGYDRNIDPDKRAKDSRTYDLTVVRPEDLERILQDRLGALKERLKQVAREQEETRKVSREFMDKLAPLDLLTDGDKRTLQRLEYDQRKVTTRLVEAKKDIEEMRTERELNRLAEEAAMSLLAELHEGVQDLGERASPLVSRELEDGRVAARLDAQLKARLNRVPDLQLDIVSALDALTARIDKWGDFTEVIQEFRDLLRGEEQIMEGTRRAAQAEHR